jgi:hypothetical protein
MFFTIILMNDSQKSTQVIYVTIKLSKKIKLSLCQKNQIIPYNIFVCGIWNVSIHKNVSFTKQKSISVKTKV